MLPIVSLEVAASDPAAPQYTAELVAACSASLREATCAAARDTTSTAADADGPTVAVVRIQWDSGTVVSLSVERASAADRSGASRTLTFAATDDEIERWRAVGFTAASMVGEPSRGVRAARAESHRALDARGLVGTAAIDQGPRVGVAGWLTVTPWRTPVSLSASAAYAISSVRKPEANIDLSWVELGVGVGFAFVPTPMLETVVRVEALVRSLSAYGALEGTNDSASTLGFGARIALDVSVPARGAWAVVMGGEAQVSDAPTVIKQRGKEVSSIPLLLEALHLGARYRF
jgi:hypothetical protein